MDKDYCIFVGERIKEVRKKKQLTQFELEIYADLNFGVICRIENGKVNPTKETLIKIAKVLELDDKQLLQLLGFEV